MAKSPETDFDFNPYVAPDYKPYNCCALMDMALDGGWLQPTLAIQFTGEPLKVHPPHIVGSKLTRTGRKKRPNLLVRFCPWCGKKLKSDDDTSEDVDHDN